MALVRILVDGYSLLHSWPELAPGRARYSAEAREELLRRLTYYQDASGVPITVFFDGNRPRGETSAKARKSEVEVLYSRAGQTADDLIERAAYRLSAYGEVLVVTDDNAERETVISVGGTTSSCWNFIQMMGSAMAEQSEDVENYNRKERRRYDRGG